MTSALPPYLITGLKLAMAMGLLLILYRVADGADAVAVLLGLDAKWAGAALLALTLQTVLSALRWRLTAVSFGIVLSRRTALGEYYLSQLFNQTLPGGVLGDAGRAVRAKAQAGLLSSAQAVLFERLAGQIALFAVFAAAALPVMLVPGGFDLPAWVRGPVTALLLLGGCGLVFLWRGELWPVAAARTVRAPLLRALLARDVRSRQIAFSLGTAVCNIAAFSFCAQAVGVTVPVAPSLVLIPLVLLSMLIPLSIGGWGLREGAAVLLLPIAGASKGEALAASVAFGLGIVIATLPGLIALMRISSMRALRP
jgi:uncharacterized membrane protein YbhN (UPF0104 family)